MSKVKIQFCSHAQIKEQLGGRIYEMCQEKLKEFNLTKDPDFLWCADVSEHLSTHVACK